MSETSEIKAQPRPDGRLAREAGHHWLEVRDYDGHSFGPIVLQWNPGAERWTYSGEAGSTRYVEADRYRYIAPCPLPAEW
jgi:hypothetical protein